MAKQKDQKKEKTDNLTEVLDDIKQKFGEGSIMKLKEIRAVDIDTVSTGSISLDAALGVGGVPRGRVIEIFGPEASGKTTLALHIMAEAQRKGGIGAFVDAEHAMDPDYAKRIGVNIEELLISQPDNGDEALNIVDSLVRSGMISVAVVDSVAALTPRAEIEGEMGTQFMGLQARMMSQALRKLTAIAARHDVLIIFINQIRMKLGVMFGNPETTPGGKALKFSSSVRLDIRRIAQIKKAEEVVGGRVKVKVVKNKVAPPFKVVEFNVMYGKGISYAGDVLQTGIKYGTVEKSGATYSFEGEKIAVGMEKATDKVEEDAKLLKAIEKATRAAAREAQK